MESLIPDFEIRDSCRGFPARVGLRFSVVAILARMEAITLSAAVPPPSARGCRDVLV